MHRKENKGFSMIEMVVVLAIMAVLVAAGATFTGLIPASRLKSCVKNTTSLIEKTRTNALSYSNASLTLEKKADGIYITTNVTKKINGENKPVPEEKQVGVSAISVYVCFEGSSEFVEMNDGDTLTLTFDHSSGAFENAEATGSISGGNDKKCTGIRFTYGSRTTTLKLYPLTGKVETQ